MTEHEPDPIEDAERAGEDELLFADPPPDVGFDPKVIKQTLPGEKLDPDAVKVVRRLARFGFEAYLVGGCVRDILFGQRPKDFDIATSARPKEVKRLFRNCRLIGRRFRLAHLLFKNGKIIEVATFRRGATEDDDVTDRHAAENLFGGPADDAIRRDFTMNSLMYDVGRREIHDYVGGIAHIETRTLATIGDPDRRFPEDPVRIIRAVKFAKRLYLTMEEPLVESMMRHAPLITGCAPARLVEEIFKLLRSGHSAPCLGTLVDLGVMDHLMPGLAAAVVALPEDHDPWPILERIDARVTAGSHVSDSTMIAGMIYPFTRHVLDEKGDVAAAFEKLLGELIMPMRFTKRHLAQVRQIIIAQRRLAGGPTSRRARRLMEREYASDALDLFELSAETDQEREIHAAWLEVFARRVEPPRRTRTRRPRRRRRSGPKKPATD